MLLCTEIIASSILDLISKQARVNAAVRTSFFLTPNVWLLQLNLVNFYLNITKRSDIDWCNFVTFGKPRENHMTCAPFANLVEWKIWEGSNHTAKSKISLLKRERWSNVRVKINVKNEDFKVKVKEKCNNSAPAHCEYCGKLWSLCDKDAILNFFLDNNFFRVPLLWLWNLTLDTDCTPISFSFSTELELH